MTDIVFMGDIPEFRPMAAILQEAGIAADYRKGPPATRDRPTLGARAVVCDARAAWTVLGGRSTTPCIVVLNESCPQAIEQWLAGGAAGCLVRPFPMALLLRNLASELARS